MATKMTALYKKELLERVIMTLLRSPHSRIYRADGPAEPKTFATIVEEANMIVDLMEKKFDLYDRLEHSELTNNNQMAPWPAKPK